MCFDRIVAHRIARSGLYDSFGSASDTTRMSHIVIRVSGPVCAAVTAAAASAQHTRRVLFQRWVRPVSFRGGASSSSGFFGDRPFTTTSRRPIASSSYLHHNDDGNPASDTCARAKPGDHGLPIVYHPAYSKPTLPSSHRFPMKVFSGIYKKLLKDGVAVPGQNLFQPARMPSVEELVAAHDEVYIDKFRLGALGDKEMRKIGLPWSPELVERTFAEVAGTILTADLALTCGLAVNTAGGTHHAHYDFGSGYCIVNDLAVTALRVLNNKQGTCRAFSKLAPRCFKPWSRTPRSVTFTAVLATTTHGTYALFAIQATWCHSGLTLF
jgi:hypothetical protein